jgi:hypothetical protein
VLRIVISTALGIALLLGAGRASADGFECGQDLPGSAKPATESLALRKDSGADTFSLLYARDEKPRGTRAAPEQKSWKTVASNLHCRSLPANKLAVHCSDGVRVFMDSKLQEDTSVLEIEGRVSASTGRNLAVAIDVFGIFWPARPDDVIHYSFNFAQSRCAPN